MTRINTLLPIRWRSIVSKNLILCFIGLTLSGIVLFLTPSGRIARETAWTFILFNKDQWQSLHNWLSIWFLILSVLHSILNWKAITLYFSTRYQNIREGWKETASALVVFAGLIWISVSFWGPADWLFQQRETFRQDIPQPVTLLNSPVTVKSDSVVRETKPIHKDEILPLHENRLSSGSGYGELLLADWCKANDIAVTTALKRLTGAGISAMETETLRTIGDRSGYGPGQLIRIIQGQGMGRGKNRRTTDF